MSSTFLLRLAGAAVAAATVLPAVPATAAGGPPEGAGHAAAPVVRGLDQACPADRVTGGGFGDVAGTHAAAIDCLAFYGVTKGGADGTYGAAKAVTRAQMATFLARVLEQADVPLPAAASDAFSDDEGSAHEGSLDTLAALGIVKGSGDGTVSPNEAVRRDQMASFLVRLLELITDEELAEAVEDYFDDTEGNVHRGPINALAGLGIAAGRAKGVFDPSSEVRRDQMATFLMRLIDRLVERGDVDVPLALHLSAEEVSPGDVVFATLLGEDIATMSVSGCSFDADAVPDSDAAAEGRQFSLTVPDAWPVEADEDRSGHGDGSGGRSRDDEGDEAEDDCEFTVSARFTDGSSDDVEGELELVDAEGGGSEGGGSEGDGSEGDGTEDDGTEDDGTEDDGTEDDGTEDDGTEDDGTEDDSSEDDGTEDDGTEDDGTEDDSTEDDGIV